MFDALPETMIFDALPEVFDLAARTETFLFDAIGEPLMSTSIFSSIGCPAPARTSCCIGVVYKRTTEKKPIMINWVPRAGAGWILQSVAHTVLLATGAALPGDDDDLVIDVSAYEREAQITKAFVSAGVDDVDYRITALATFRDCSGNEIHLSECVTVSVSDC